MCLAESTIKLLGTVLKIFLLFILLCQTFLGLGLTITAGVVLKEAAPDKPDTTDQGKLEASLSMFNYAGDIKSFSGTAIAKACVMLMCTGILMTGFGIMGFTSIASGRPKFLVLFLALLVVSSTAATYVATQLIEYRTLTLEALDEVMLWSLQTQYDGNFNSTNRWSRLWDVGHIKFKCCGINNSTDFAKAQKFEEIYLGPEIGFNVTGKFYERVVPISCCKTDGDIGVAIIDSLKSGVPQPDGKFILSDDTCANSVGGGDGAKPENSNMNMGCKEALETLITKYSSLVSGMAVTTFSMQVVLQLGIIVMIYASMS